MRNVQSCSVRLLPADRTVAVPAGTTLLDACRRAGVAPPVRCGGKLGCLMCKVRVTAGGGQGLQEPSVQEKRKLGTLLDGGYRFACQARIAGDVEAEVPEDPLKAAVRRKLEAARRGEEESLW
ncbi:2Fe-2S iron-sulfur cluster binding domain-containing protein [Paenibacillus spiritus]|uniref:2Fe-2S iron-sulfur cluster binding domain-containing protein n=1 Tax=Paenibacillus spiritus TaxID=2496557 RepID=A0A5J5GHI6_9BACL|nr:MULTISPECIES: 2Fe-2S iron-sulfur cluster-binding protein [Paenibacillus]KAA9007178.1 2Fe-2S iron-sulfur cluster binding domain-containing protein [Paenibacillus spiritus]